MAHDSKYFYFGVIGIILLGGFATFVYISETPSIPFNSADSYVLEFKAVGTDSPETFSAEVDAEKLFSEDPVTLTFSPADTENNYIYLDCSFNCEKIQYTN